MTPYLEIGGDWREPAPGIFLLELPLPFSLGLINAYLVRMTDGWMLVDTGMDTDHCFQALDRARAGLGLAWSDIRRILLTHIHPDHMGLAHRLRTVTGARVLLHTADERLLSELADFDRFRDWQDELLAQAGVAPGMIRAINAAMKPVHRSFRKLHADEPLSGGEILDGAYGPLEVLWTPGHSPGHVCVYDRGRGLLFSGDHMLEHVSPNIGWHPGHDPLSDFLDSLDRIAALDIALVLPSHGAPFSGHREWIARTRTHHDERCERILGILDHGPRTAAETVERLWEGLTSPFHYRFAAFEVLAHLEYLERRGLLSRERDGDEVIRWKALRR